VNIPQITEPSSEGRKKISGKKVKDALLANRFAPSVCNSRIFSPFQQRVFLPKPKLKHKAKQHATRNTNTLQII
jgi:hypothetical protein